MNSSQSHWPPHRASVSQGQGERKPNSFARELSEFTRMLCGPHRRDCAPEAILQVRLVTAPRTNGSQG